MSRKHQQAEMFFILGQLFGPLLSLAKNPSSFDADEQTRIIARFTHDCTDVETKLQQYSVGEQGHNYFRQLNEICHVLSILRTRSTGKATWEIAESHIDQAFKSLLSIPVPIDSAIYDAQSPLATYRLVRDMCSTCSNVVTWLDRYFDHTIFHRYLSDAPSSALITLVTYPKSKCQGSRDIQRYDEFLDISRMFAQDRGPTGYRLLVEESFHDRLLRCDDKLLSLGGSIKDIAKAASFTISRIDSTPENFQRINDVIAAATELFGTSNTTHP